MCFSKSFSVFVNICIGLITKQKTIGGICMARALDVANYITTYALKNDIKIYHLHIQKILYYLEAAHLVQRRVSLLDEDIEMWRLGPVVPNVYHNYKTFGARPISNVPKELRIDNGSIRYVGFDENILTPEVKAFIERNIVGLLNIDPFKLVEMTHEHKPWAENKELIESGVQDLLYDKDDIREYFEQHPEELMGVGIQ